ncbi:hypothetical protein Bca4012_063296 [Brassica carinata]
MSDCTKLECQTGCPFSSRPEPQQTRHRAVHSGSIPRRLRPPNGLAQPRPPSAQFFSDRPAEQTLMECISVLLDAADRSRKLLHTAGCSRTLQDA